MSTKFSSWFEQSNSTTHDSFAKCCPTNFDYQAFKIVGVATLFLNRGGLKGLKTTYLVMPVQVATLFLNRGGLKEATLRESVEKQNVATLLLSRGGLKETTAFQAGVNSVATVFPNKEDISYDSPPL